MSVASVKHVHSVLIVDDDVAVGTVLGALCRQAGFEARAVTSGAAALEALAARPYDAAIVDLRMLGMSGLELLAQMTAEYPETAVIMLTAHGTVEDAVRAMKLGAIEFMAKSFDRDELVFVLGRATARTGDTVTLAFADTGVGIEPRYLAKVADDFVTTKAHGSGLGLAFARRVALAHDGALRITSQPGQGTTVTLVLTDRT